METLISRPRLALSLLFAGFALALFPGCVVAVHDHDHPRPPPPPPEVRADVIIR